MAILPLTKHPAPLLRERSKNVDDPANKKIQKLILDMNDTMIDADGIGIAAPQVGVNICLFLVRTDSKRGYDVYMNPTISGMSLRKRKLEEGCLSVPGTFGPVKRALALTIAYTNEKGEQKKEKAQGLLARVLQHEYDHIDGTLFIDRAESLETQ